jgi:hypothetical protein
MSVLSCNSSTGSQVCATKHRGRDLEEHQPMKVQRGEGLSAGGDEGCNLLQRVAKGFSPVVAFESCFNCELCKLKVAELEL